MITSRLAGASSAAESGGCGRLLNDPTDVRELASYLSQGSGPAVQEQWSLGASAARSFNRPFIFAEVDRVFSSRNEVETLGPRGLGESSS